MEKIQVGYNRKESTDDYGSVGISGLVEFVPQSDNLQEEFDAMFIYLKTVVDQKAEILKESKPSVVNNNVTTVLPADEETQSAGADVTVQSEPEAEKPKPKDGDIFLSKAKVFRYIKKKDRNNKAFVELRIGHEDLNGYIGDQYITVKTWDPEAIEAVSSLRDKTKVRDGTTKDESKVVEDVFVDAWGKFNPWISDPNNYDLNATGLKISS